MADGMAVIPDRVDQEDFSEMEDSTKAAAAAAAAALLEANHEWEGSDNEDKADPYQSSDDGGTIEGSRSRRGSRRESRPLVRRKSLEPAGRGNGASGLAAFWSSKGNDSDGAPFPGITFYNETLPEGEGVTVYETGAAVNHEPFPGIPLYTEEEEPSSPRSVDSLVDSFEELPTCQALEDDKSKAKDTTS